MHARLLCSLRLQAPEDLASAELEESEGEEDHEEAVVMHRRPRLQGRPDLEQKERHDGEVERGLYRDPGEEVVEAFDRSRICSPLLLDAQFGVVGR